MKAILLSLLFFAICIPTELFSQDTLVLIDRKPKYGELVETGPDYVKFKRKRRIRTFERDKVFSLRSTSGTETILYVRDSLEGNIYSAEDMAFYISGQEDARRSYGTNATLWSIPGLFVGGVSSLNAFYGPVAIILYPVTVGLPAPAQKSGAGFDQRYKGNVFYSEGYATQARKMKVRRSFITTASGFIAGTVLIKIFVN